MIDCGRWKIVAALAVTWAVGAGAQQKTEAVAPVSFAQDVVPIINRSCMPCHAQEQSNPSELSLDSYELLMEGGKNGHAVVPGDPSKSTLVTKLLAEPPFGDRMPLDPRRKRRKEPMKPLPEEEIRVITEWVKQGAKDN